MAFEQLRFACGAREKREETSYRVRLMQCYMQRRLFLVLPFAVVTNQIRQNVVYMSLALCMIIQFVCSAWMPLRRLVRLPKRAFRMGVRHLWVTLCAPHECVIMCTRHCIALTNACAVLWKNIALSQSIGNAGIYNNLKAICHFESRHPSALNQSRRLARFSWNTNVRLPLVESNWFSFAMALGCR